MIAATRETSRTHRCRAFTLIEVALTVFLLALAMTSLVKVLGWVANERRAAERRQWAIAEVGNLMDRLTAPPYDKITAEAARARGAAVLPEARRRLPDADLAVNVDETNRAGEPPGKRLSIRLRWRIRGGAWEAPVRLTAWIARLGSESGGVQ
jgi:Tfp pilus assembly protein PilV